MSDSFIRTDVSHPYSVRVDPLLLRQSRAMVT